MYIKSLINASFKNKRLTLYPSIYIIFLITKLSSLLSIDDQSQKLNHVVHKRIRALFEIMTLLKELQSNRA